MTHVRLSPTVYVIFHEVNGSASTMQRHLLTVFVRFALVNRAVLYKNHYLHEDDFDNFYITKQFVEMDRKFSRRGSPAVLPLTEKEALTYITPCETVCVCVWMILKRLLHFNNC